MRRSPEEAASQEHVASDRPYDERLQQTPVGVAPNHSGGQEDGEDGPEEEGGEHGQPEDGRTGQGRRVHAEIGCFERVDLLECTIGAEGVEDEKPGGEQHDTSAPACAAPPATRSRPPRRRRSRALLAADGSRPAKPGSATA